MRLDRFETGFSSETRQVVIKTDPVCTIVEVDVNLGLTIDWLMNIREDDVDLIGAMA